MKSLCGNMVKIFDIHLVTSLLLTTMLTNEFLKTDKNGFKTKRGYTCINWTHNTTHVIATVTVVSITKSEIYSSRCFKRLSVSRAAIFTIAFKLATPFGNWKPAMAIADEQKAAASKESAGNRFVSKQQKLIKRNFVFEWCTGYMFQLNDSHTHFLL